MAPKMRDNKGRILQMGEWQEPNGRYRYIYNDALGKRKIYIVGDLLRQIQYQRINTRRFRLEKRKSRFSPYLCKVFQVVI